MKQYSKSCSMAIKSKFTFILFAIIFLSLSSSVHAQESDSTKFSASKYFSNSINMCPVALAFNFYSVNFEHLFNGTHGLVARFDYESISDTYSNNPIELSGYGFILNYRYHLSGQMESIFLGSYARYRIYDGNGKAGSTDFDMSISEASFGLNLGKRWVWNSGFNILFSLGYGFSLTDRKTTPENDSIKQTVDAFEDEYTFFGPFFGELSIGYAF